MRRRQQTPQQGRVERGQTPLRFLLVTRLPLDDAVLNATLATHLDTAGVPREAVHLICRRPRELDGENCALSDCRITYLPDKGPHLLGVRRAINRALNDPVDVIVARDEVSLALALSTGTRRPIRWDRRGDVVAEMRDYGGLGARSRAIVMTLLSLLAARTADRTLTVTQYLADDVLARNPRAPVAVVPNGPRPVSIARAETDRPMVLYAGGAHPWQDMDATLRVVAALQSAAPEINIEFYTKDEGLSRRVQELGLCATAGDATTVGQALQRATASIVLRKDTRTTRSASPVKIGEALAAGCGVIATNTTWERIHDVVQNGDAFIVDPRFDVQRLRAWVLERHASGMPRRKATQETSYQLLSPDSHRQSLEWFYGHPSVDPRGDLDSNRAG